MSNYKFKTTNIRGKQYVEVNERIKFFRQEEQYKNWSIVTDFPILEADQCVCKAAVVDPSNRIIATGYAHEDRTASNINKTSYVENCETSAVGRALAMLGIGIEVSIASANEVAEAIAKQESEPKEENIMDKAVAYVKSQTDKQKAYDAIIGKYGDQMTDKQKSGLKKFVR
jgi:hypothetical protein